MAEKTTQSGGYVTDPHEPDIEIAAHVRADELRSDTEPDVEVRFPGSGRRDSRQVTTRENIDRPINRGKTYRRVFVATRISSRLLDDDAFG
jgi:hypothetical protein